VSIPCGRSGTDRRVAKDKGAAQSRGAPRLLDFAAQVPRFGALAVAEVVKERAEHSRLVRLPTGIHALVKPHHQCRERKILTTVGPKAHRIVRVQRFARPQRSVGIQRERQFLVGAQVPLGLPTERRSARRECTEPEKNEVSTCD